MPTPAENAEEWLIRTLAGQSVAGLDYDQSRAGYLSYQMTKDPVFKARIEGLVTARKMTGA